MGYARGIEHVGMTVPDIAKAEAFFASAFGAEVLYRGLTKDQHPQPGDDLVNVNGLPEGNAQVAISMLRIGTGANLELFEVSKLEGQSPTIATAGPTHISVYVDDLQKSAEAVVAAGGTMLDGPQDCYGPEAGVGNRIWFCRAPWSTLIELVHLPTPVASMKGVSVARFIPT